MGFAWQWEICKGSAISKEKKRFGSKGDAYTASLEGFLGHAEMGMEVTEFGSGFQGFGLRIRNDEKVKKKSYYYCYYYEDENGRKEVGLG